MSRSKKVLRFENGGRITTGTCCYPFHSSSHCLLFLLTGFTDRQLSTLQVAAAKRKSAGTHLFVSMSPIELHVPIESFRRVLTERRVVAKWQRLRHPRCLSKSTKTKSKR